MYINFNYCIYIFITRLDYQKQIIFWFGCQSTKKRNSFDCLDTCNSQSENRRQKVLRNLSGKKLNLTKLPIQKTVAVSSSTKIQI